MGMTSKAKKPEKVNADKAVVDYYKNHANLFIEEGKTTIGYRYDQVEGRTFWKPEGKVTQNNVTLSPTSSEVLTLMKERGEWFLVMGKQCRSPYLVEVDGKVYSKVFIEQAAGLVENNQNFVTAAIAEAEQELGTKLSYLGILVEKVYRHVSYTDEVSKVYLAIAESIGEQSLDTEENIETIKIPLNKARYEFENYLDGKTNNFFGFDIPDLTIISLERLFWKIEKGLDLENLSGNLLK